MFKRGLSKSDAWEGVVTDKNRSSPETGGCAADRWHAQPAADRGEDGCWAGECPHVLSAPRLVLPSDSIIGPSTTTRGTSISSVSAARSSRSRRTPASSHWYLCPVVPASYHDFFSACATVAGALTGTIVRVCDVGAG